MSQSDIELADAFQRLWMYTVSIFAATEDFLEEPGVYCGTGTLVYNGHNCLLTAAHVWDLLKPDRFTRLGFTLRPERKGISIPKTLQVTRHRVVSLIWWKSAEGVIIRRSCNPKRLRPLAGGPRRMTPCRTIAGTV